MPDLKGKKGQEDAHAEFHKMRVTTLMLAGIIIALLIVIILILAGYGSS